MHACICTYNTLYLAYNCVRKMEKYCKVSKNSKGDR